MIRSERRAGTDSRGDRGGQVITCAGNSVNLVMKLTFRSRLPVPLRMIWLERRTGTDSKGDRGG